jgi:hypothetical protein
MATMFLQTTIAKSRFCRCAALLALSVGWAVTPASAAIIFLGDSVPLSTLLQPDASLQVGDKIFTGFGYDHTGDMPDATGVNVRPILDDLDDGNPNTGNYGIRFQGAFMDLASSPNGSDALITYMVEATAPGFLISDAHLAGNPARLGPFGSISVTETFLPLGPNGEHTMTIYDDESNPIPKLVDWTFFNPPVKKLNVQKDIIAKAILVPGSTNATTVTLSFVDQTFSQVVPEPTTLLLCLSGIALVMAGRPRRRIDG